MIQILASLLAYILPCYVNNENCGMILTRIKNKRSSLNIFWYRLIPATIDFPLSTIEIHLIAIIIFLCYFLCIIHKLQFQLLFYNEWVRIIIMKMINQTPKRHILIKLVNSNNISTALRKMNRLIKNNISALPQKNFKIKNWYNNNQCNNRSQIRTQSATILSSSQISRYEYYHFSILEYWYWINFLKILWLHFHSRLTRKVNWLLSFHYHHHCQINASCSRVSSRNSFLFLSVCPYEL